MNLQRLLLIGLSGGKSNFVITAGDETFSDLSPGLVDLPRPSHKPA
jgi:hypothetical protein